MPKTLLLADDSITIQRVVGITFATEDFQVVSVDNGEDALAKAREIHPDLLLADVVMPRRNGYELCQAVKGDAALRHIPVLLLAGTFEPFDEGRAKAVGADGFIPKPFESQALIDKVRQLLEAAPGAGAAPRPQAAAPRPQAAAPAPAPAPAPSTVQPRPIFPSPAAAPEPRAAQPPLAATLRPPVPVPAPGPPGSRPPVAAPRPPAPVSPFAAPPRPAVAAPGARPPITAPVVRPPAATPGFAPAPMRPVMVPPAAARPAASPAPAAASPAPVFAAARPAPAPAPVAPARPPISPPPPVQFPTAGTPPRGVVPASPAHLPKPRAATPPPSPVAAPVPVAVRPRAPAPIASPPLAFTLDEEPPVRALAPPAAAPAVTDQWLDVDIAAEARAAADAAMAPPPQAAAAPRSALPELGLDELDFSDEALGAVPTELALEAIELPEVELQEEPMELAPMHAFVPPPESVGHQPEPTVLLERAGGDGGEAQLRDALSRASLEVIEKIAWEVVPVLAETIIREHLDRLVRERQGS